MGVPIDALRTTQIDAERNRLIKNLEEVSRLRSQLDEAVDEIERGITSLQFMIDPENN